MATNLNSRMARAFFDHNDAKRQKLRRTGGPSGPAPAPVAEPIDADTFSTKVGDGTTSIDSGANTLTIAYGTTATSLRGTHPVTVNTRYRVSWSQSGTASGLAAFGTSAGGVQYRPALAGVIGANTFDFSAVADPLHISFQRTAAGTTTFGDLSIVEIAPVTWADTGLVVPASFTVFTNGASLDAETGIITIPATGTMAVARASIATEIGKLYRWIYTISDASAFAIIGSSAGGSQLKPPFGSELGAKTYEFTATSTTTHFQFHRTTAGTATVAAFLLQEVGA